jgi:hypothetical protein
MGHAPARHACDGEVRGAGAPHEVSDEAGLVAEDHGLDPVADLELGQDP